MKYLKEGRELLPEGSTQPATEYPPTMAEPDYTEFAKSLRIWSIWDKCPPQLSLILRDAADIIDGKDTP